jgi:DNA repair exonuclease SbcCD ATPase subunit
VDYNAEMLQVTAHFGYINANAGTISIPVGVSNYFDIPPSYRGQPTEFLPGTQHNAFTATFQLDQISSLTWWLAGIPVTASLDSPRCLQSQITELQQQLAAANQTIQSQQTQITLLQNQNSELSQQIASLSQQNSTLSQQVTSLMQQVTSLQSQLTAANNQNAALMQANAELQTAITNFIKSVQQDLRQTFGDPQFTIDGATPTVQLQTLQTALENLKRGNKLDLYKSLGGK